MRLQGKELQQMLALLQSLDPPSWSAPADRPDWDVRAMAQHVLGACEAGASMRESIRQLRLGYVRRRCHGGPLEAALSSPGA